MRGDDRQPATPWSSAGAERSGRSGPSRKPWLPGAIACGVAVVVGFASLALFCFALGVNLQDEGWPADAPDRGAEMVASFVGFAAATLIFWGGFIHATHAK